MRLFERRFRGAWLVCWSAAVGWGPSARAGDPWQMIPADVAGVIVFRQPAESAKQFTRLMKKIDKDCDGVDLDEATKELKLDAGSWDRSAPVFVILTRPEFDESSWVVAYTPARPKEFAEKLGGRRGQPVAIESADGTHFLMLRKGVAFAGTKRRALRRIAETGDGESLWAALDSRQKDLYGQSDAWAYLALDRWRSKFDSYVSLACNMVRLGAAAEQTARKPEELAVLDWMLGGIRGAIDEMKGLTVSLAYDGTTLRLSHHHTFTPDGKVAAYLSNVRHEERRSLDAIPDRPFLALLAADVSAPAEDSLSMKMCKHIYSLESITKELSVEQREKLLETMSRFYGQARGSYMQFSTAREGSLPLCFFGGYLVDDADKGMEQFAYIQEHSARAMAAFITGGECMGGKFEWRKTGDMKFLEARWDTEKLPKGHTQESMQAIYGKDVRFQQAAADGHHLAYSFAAPPIGVVEFINARRSGRSVAENPAVKRLMGQLPQEAHVVAVFDLERCLEMVVTAKSTMAATSRAESKTTGASDAGSEAKGTGPLLGWAGVVEGKSFTGTWAIDGDDAAATARLGRQMKKRIGAGEGEVQIKVQAGARKGVKQD